MKRCLNLVVCSLLLVGPVIAVGRPNPAARAGEKDRDYTPQLRGETEVEPGYRLAMLMVERKDIGWRDLLRQANPGVRCGAVAGLFAAAGGNSRPLPHRHVRHLLSYLPRESDPRCLEELGAFLCRNLSRLVWERGRFVLPVAPVK